MRKLPRWCITHQGPAFYDTESATAVEQTAKLYGAMEELINEYNEFVSKIETEINNFETSTNQNYEEFKVHIDKIVHDYIALLDLKIAHQDKVIEENITYIKENIASELERIVNEMKASGELEAIVGDSLEGLTTSINNLTNKVTTLENDNIINKSKIESLEKQEIKYIYSESTKTLYLELGGKE